MSDYLVSPLERLTSQTDCCLINSPHTPVGILTVIPARFGASSYGLNSLLYPYKMGEMFARRDTKWLTGKWIQMEL